MPCLPVTFQMYLENSGEFDACVPYCRAKGKCYGKDIPLGKSSPCLLRMLVEQSQAYNSLHRMTIVERRCAGRRWPRESQGQSRAGVSHGPCHVCRVQDTCRGRLALSHASGTCVRSRRVRTQRCSSRRAETQPVYTAPAEARVSRACTMVRFDTRHTMTHPSYRSATSLRLASVSPSM
jgi:hypothetical protein